jgi:hypothetical protein
MIQSRPSAERPLPRASRPFAGQARSGSILPVRQAVRQWPVFAHCGRVPRRLRTAVTPSAQARDWTLTLICNVDHHVSQGARGYLAARSLCVPKDARFRYSTGMPAASAASIPRLIPGVIPRSCRRPMPRRPQLHRARRGARPSCTPNVDVGRHFRCRWDIERAAESRIMDVRLGLKRLTPRAHFSELPGTCLASRALTSTTSNPRCSSSS